MAHLSRSLSTVATFATAVVLTSSLTACANDGTPVAPATSSSIATSESPVSTVQSETATPETSSEAPATTSSAAGSETKTSATKASSSRSSSEEAEAELVNEVSQRFSTLAPKELFDQLQACTASGIEGSFDCSGPEIGQFQFFDSEAKAASTTQLLTELRSSRVVEDKGDRVVGWSVLGTSAIITVVDNRAGQVVQQLISTDQEDPRKRIYELGLAEQVVDVSTPAAG